MAGTLVTPLPGDEAAVSISLGKTAAEALRFLLGGAAAMAAVEGMERFVREVKRARTRHEGSRPCIPPAGTLCYTGKHTTHEHAGMRVHTHCKMVFQSPPPAYKCCWNTLDNVLEGMPEEYHEPILPCEYYPNPPGGGGQL